MNKVAVVTGGASGIGRAIAERFARDKFTAVILDINEENGKQVAAEINSRGEHAAFFGIDVTQESAVHAGFQKITSDHGRVISSSTSPAAPRTGTRLKNFHWSTGRKLWIE